MGWVCSDGLQYCEECVWCKCVCRWYLEDDLHVQFSQLSQLCQGICQLWSVWTSGTKQELHNFKSQRLQRLEVHGFFPQSHWLSKNWWHTCVWWKSIHTVQILAMLVLRSKKWFWPLSATKQKFIFAYI